MIGARRGMVALLLAAVIAAVVVAVLFVRAGSGAAAGSGTAAGSDLYCGSLPAPPGSAVNGVTAALTSVPATITARHTVTASMLVTADHPPATIVSGDDARLLPRTVDAAGLVMSVGGEAYRCVDLDDPSTNTTEPLPAGDYRLAAVLDTEAGPLVTSLVPIRVA